MRRGPLAGLLVAGGIAVGAGGVVVSGAFADDKPVEIVTIESPAPAGGTASANEIVVEDGIPRADARRLAAAAGRDTPGRVLSVERDDDLFEVEVRLAGGRHAEILLDDAFDVVGRDGDD